MNVRATKLEIMICWKGTKKSVLTCDLTKAELKQFRDTPTDVPYYFMYTQGLESAVKEVT